MSKDYPAATPNTYVSPLPAGDTFHFESAYTIYPYDFKDIPTVYSDFKQTYTLEVVQPNGETKSETYNRFISGSHGLPPERVYETGTNNGIDIELQSGVYTVKYSFKYTYPIGSPKTHTATYTFQVVENQYPIRPFTIKDVIQRILRVIEPLVVERKSDGSAQYVKEPRFLFGYKYAADTDEGREERKIFELVSPEFSFTHMTLREEMQQIGQFIHAQPRIVWRAKNDPLNVLPDGVTPSSERVMVWIFDQYFGKEQATYKENGTGMIKPFTEHPYKAKRFYHDIGVACTSVESDTDNFVNRLDKLGGTITEPFRGGAVTLRTDQTSLRFEDAEGSLYLPTTRAVMDVTSLVWVDLEGLAGTANARYDITPYVFEKTAYDAELSSYDAQYPRSKCYALYYTQGQKNINGFFFKNTAWSGGVFENYSIVNILEQVTNTKLKNKITKEKYPTLAFEITYTPMYGARVSHGKSNINEMLKKPFALIYNASANVVETRYYGEHLKGVAERLGNVDQEVDLIIRNVNNLPKIGQTWDDKYYISSVKGSAVYDGVILNIGLTKNFNRISAYVGANSYKRYYEVSERMAVQRKTLYKDYLVITQAVAPNQKSCAVSMRFLYYVLNTFFQSADIFTKSIISLVNVTGYSKKFNPSASVYLPVTSSAFGNCMEFTWDFKDNYSAGLSSVHKEQNSVSGYFGAEVPYGDYYGRMYYEQWTLGVVNDTYPTTEELALALPNAFKGENGATVPPQNAFGIMEDIYQVIDKDSREMLFQAYSIEYVTDMDGVIIGSALARNNPAIGGIIKDFQGFGVKAVMYILSERLNPLAPQFDPGKVVGAGIDITSGTESASGNQASVVTDDYQNSYVKFGGAASTVAGKAWAIVTIGYQGETHTVENADGDPETITDVYGGEILIAQNIDVTVGDVVGQFNIMPTHDLYDFQKIKVTPVTGDKEIN